MKKRLGEIIIIVLMVFNAYEATSFFKLRTNAGLYGSDVQFPVPSGYLMDKSYMAEDAVPCYVLRVSSDSCPFCRLDQERYRRLVQEAQKAQCKTVILAPKTGQVKWNGNSGRNMQLQYVDMKLGRVLIPFLTPETILLNKVGHIAWYQEGSMDDRALEGALSALRKIR